MTVPNTFTSGVNTSFSSQLNANFTAVEVTANKGYLLSPWEPMITDSNVGQTKQAIIVHSATTWTMARNGDARRTTDGGLTWSDTTGAGLGGCECISNRAYGMMWGAAGSSIYFTTNSGATWTITTTGPTLTTIVNSIAFPTPASAVCAVTSTSTRKLFYSTNNGVTWTMCTTGPTTECVSVAMYDASIGYALDTAGHIWKTTNGGVDWTDTTHQVVTTPPTAASVSMICVSATVVLLAIRNGQHIVRYNNAVGAPILVASLPTATASSGALTNFVKTTAGYYYVCFTLTASSSTTGSYIYRSKDSGITWQSRAISSNSLPNVNRSCGLMSEYTTNKLLLFTGVGMAQSSLTILDETAE